MFRVLIFLAGCGFQTVPSTTDLSAADLSTTDLAGIDLAGIDLSETRDLSTGGGTGPGPLGALPAGFCCNANEECRSRLCANRDGVSFCTELCTTDEQCNTWGGAFICDQLNGACLPSGITAMCVPASQYSYGSLPTGACCAHGFAKAGQECLGGLCVTTGAASNPFYCTQGCNSHTLCPGGYSCNGGFCWISGTVGDTSFTYTCQ